MKASKLFILKEKLQSDKRQFDRKDYSKEIEYKSTVENILTRISRIEEGEIKKEQYLRDIDKHLKRMAERLKITFDLEGNGDKEPGATKSTEDSKTSDGSIIPTA